MSNDLIKHVTDATFEAEVLKATGPVLVDYWAEWCGPCKMIAPVLDDIATTYEGKLTIAKLNIDDNQETPAKGPGGDTPCVSALWAKHSVTIG